MPNDLIPAAATAMVALVSVRGMLEEISDGMSVPSIDTIRRHHERVDDAVADLVAAGVTMKLK